MNVRSKSNLEKIKVISAGASFLLGLLALAGWAFKWHLLASISSDFIPMAPLTAVIFIVLAFVLISCACTPERRFLKLSAGAVVSLFSVYGLWEFIEYFIKTEINFEGLLFPVAGKLGNFPIGHMSPITGLLFFLCGVSIILNILKHGKAFNIVSIIGSIVVFSGFTATLGYIFGTPLLYGGSIIPLAMTTSVAFFCLGIGIVAMAGPESFILRQLMGNSAKARLLRSVLFLTSSAILMQALLQDKLALRLDLNHSLLAVLMVIVFIVLSSVVVIYLSKKIFEETAKAEEALKRSEEKYKVIFENAKDAILIADIGTGVIVDANKSAEALLGWSREELIGMDRVKLHPQNEAEYYDRQFQRHVGDHSVSEEAVMVKKDGIRVFVQIDAALTEINGKKVIQGIFHDLTERKKMEKDKADLQAQLVQSEKMSAIGQLAAGVAHEINNPMTSILGFTQLLLRAHKEGDTEYDKLKKIEISSQRCKDIVRQLLVYSRTKSAEALSVDIHEMLNSVLALTENHLKMANVTVVREYENNIVRAEVPQQLEQVFMNIISNAGDAMPSGGRLIIRTQMENGKIAVRFTDTGEGIAKENLEKIFTPFYTTKKAGQGTGLGLPIVKTLLASMQGDIKVESEPGKGSTFTLILPAKK